MKRNWIIVALALPGAVLVGSLGVMAAAFSGDASPPAAAMVCWMFWGIFGGACVGAMPGLLAGLLMNARWVIPLVGAGLGAVFDMLFAGLVWEEVAELPGFRAVVVQ